MSDRATIPAARPATGVGPVSSRPRARARHVGVGVAAAVLAATVGFGVRAVYDPSPWLHLRVAEALLHGQRFGTPDPWAPFATKAFLPTEWLPSLVADLSYRVAGLPGIAWLRCLGILLLLAALTWTTRRVARPTVAFLCAAGALAGAWPGLTERPQLVSFVLLAVTLGAWWRTATDGRPRWWLVPLTFVWACSHGLWFLGVGVGVLTVAGLALDHRLPRARAAGLLAVPALSLLAAAVTPLGPRLLLTPFLYGANGAEFVKEWQATSFRDPPAALTLAMLVAIAVLWARSRHRPPWWETLLLGLALVATFAMSRLVPVGAVLAAPLLADAVQHRLSGQAPRPVSGREWRVLGALSLAAALLAMPLAAARAQAPAAVPTRLGPALSGIPAGTVVLDDDDLSGWLLWSQPQLRPVVDLRSEIYPHAHLARYVAALAAAPGWQSFVRNTGARYAVLRADAPLAGALVDRLGWRRLGADAGFVLLEAP